MELQGLWRFLVVKHNVNPLLVKLVPVKRNSKLDRGSFYPHKKEGSPLKVMLTVEIVAAKIMQGPCQQVGLIYQELTRASVLATQTVK